MKFLSDEEGELRKNIFDSNVRDYEWNVEVNAAIHKTLEDLLSPARTNRVGLMLTARTALCETAQ